MTTTSSSSLIRYWRWLLLLLTCSQKAPVVVGFFTAHHHHHPSRSIGSSFIVESPAIISTTTTRHSIVALQAISSSGLWNAGSEFGKGPFRFFRSFDEWMKPFPEEDRLAYPELFRLPVGVTEVSLPKPLGLLLEEVEPGRGVLVDGFVPGGNAERLAADRIQPGDVIVGVTAVKVVGAKWERRMIPCRKLNYDIVVYAIGSNDRKWGCDDVVLWLERPSIANPDQTNALLDLFEPPLNNPWKQ